MRREINNRTGLIAAAIVMMVCLCFFLQTGLSYAAQDEAAGGKLMKTDGTVQYLPDVTADMCKADYWSGKISGADKVLADLDEIRAVNKIIYDKGKETRDLANWSQETYNGIEQNALNESSLRSDAEYYNAIGVGFVWDEESQEWTREGAMEEIYEPLIANSQDPNAEKDMPVRYAICTSRVCMQGFPGDTPLWDDPADPDFDYLYHTMMKINEPMVLKSTSADGKYYLALSAGISGWIPADAVAICKDKEEWLAAWNSDDVLVVYDDKIYTEDSNYTPQTANRKIPMGSRLLLATEQEAEGRIGNRTAHNNYVVWMPIRNDDGTFSRELALIGQNRKVHEGYLPLTTANILDVAMNQLGDAYGWGGMLGSEDCSGFMRDIYACFGLDMTRSVNRSEGLLKEWDLSQMSDEEKLACVKKLPPGAILAFSGHEMMYLGREGDKLYVISSVSNIRIPGDDHNTRVRGCVINTLDIWRASNTSWLHNLNHAELPYYAAEHADPVFENPMTAAGNTVSVKASKLKKKSVTIPAAKAITVTDAVGKLKYTKKAGVKKISVAGNGNIKVGRGLARGTYQVKVRVRAKGATNKTGTYKSVSQTTIVTISVK